MGRCFVILAINAARSHPVRGAGVSPPHPQPAPVWVLCPLTPRISVPAPPSQQLRLPLWVWGPLLGAPTCVSAWCLGFLKYLGKKQDFWGFSCSKNGRNPKNPLCRGCSWALGGRRVQGKKVGDGDRATGRGTGRVPGHIPGAGRLRAAPRGAARRGAAAPALPRSFFHPFPVLYPKTSWLGENPAGAPRVYEAAAAVGLPQRGSWLSPSVVWGLQRSGCWWGAGGVLVSQVGAVGTTRLCPPHLSPFSSWEEPPGGAESAPGGVGEGGRGLSPQGAPFILPWLRPPASSCRPRGFQGKQTPEADQGTGAAAPGGGSSSSSGGLGEVAWGGWPQTHTIWGGQLEMVPRVER